MGLIIMRMETGAKEGVLGQPVQGNNIYYWAAGITDSIVYIYYYGGGHQEG